MHVPDGILAYKPTTSHLEFYNLIKYKVSNKFYLKILVDEILWKYVVLFISSVRVHIFDIQNTNCFYNQSGGGNSH